ncbi:MAG: divergent polysaccharide deacetylase family protein [Alphaproteobacteria bacterium]|nr:divergent polysaccharide deacetylase family protein [Alphaproteobacteria bacterium]MCL2505538.1 divergent polysaccharide deacetylase family protein [Alphaproteobacteria bacterium]
MSSDQNTPDINTNTVNRPPVRKETFLAKYPRNLKLSVTAFILSALILLGFIITAEPHSLEETHTQQTEYAPAQPVPALKKEISFSAGAPALNDSEDRSVVLAPAPSSLVALESPDGTLPIVGRKGETSRQVYARPFDNKDERPRIAFVLTGIGFSKELSDLAAAQISPSVTLAISPHADSPAAWAKKARSSGHEILLEIPVEPFDYPESDPGPGTLLTSMSEQENKDRLLAFLKSAAGYVGLIPSQSSVFLTNPSKFANVLWHLKQRGLLLVYNNLNPSETIESMAFQQGVPVAFMTVKLDDDLSPEGIENAFKELETAALEKGRAVGAASINPLILTMLNDWSKTLADKGIVLAPVSAVTQ